MFNLDPDLTLEQQLSQIPPEFQEAFRQAMEQELADSEQNRTDTDILHYLRERRSHFQRGGFIRPDGRPGMVTMSSEEIYERAMPELMRNALGQNEDSAERRQTIFKLIGFAALAIIFILFALRGRAQRNADDEIETEATVELAAAVDVTPSPTPSLPEVSGADESLKTIGGLGGALTIGRPSSLELHYAATEDVIALPIDPSKPTTKGELRYNAAVMASENPVAVWLFGTVLNYGIGIPDTMIRNLVVGDRVVVNTDTGATLRFVVSSQWQGANHESSRLLSQDKTGLTLFSLPASSEDNVSFAFASYDISSEDDLGQTIFGLGDSFSFAAAGAFSIDHFHYTQTDIGTTHVVLTGSTSLSNSLPVMLSLTSSLEQTAAIPLSAARLSSPKSENGRWSASFPLSDGSSDLPLFAELRLLPSELAIVQLGDVPTLHDLLEIEVQQAAWSEVQQRVIVTLHLHNPTNGHIQLAPDFIQQPQGGDVYFADVQVNPYLPTLIQPGEAMGMQVSLLPDPILQLQIGSDLWELSGLPEDAFSEVGELSRTTETAATTDR